MSNDKKSEFSNVQSPVFPNVNPGMKKPDFSNVESGASSSAPIAPKADFGNVQSGASSTATIVQPAGSTHTVEKGESLSVIAKQHYGKASLWTRIYDANRDQLDDPDRIKPGQVLNIPAADADA